MVAANEMRVFMQTPSSLSIIILSLWAFICSNQFRPRHHHHNYYYLPSFLFHQNFIITSDGDFEFAEDHDTLSVEVTEDEDRMKAEVS